MTPSFDEFADCRRVCHTGGLAIDPRKLLLGGVALLVLETGQSVIQSLPFATQSPSLDVTAPLDLGWSPNFRILEIGVGLLLAPLRSVIWPGLEIFRSGSSWPELATAWTRLLWALIVWSVFGGALTRMAALQFAQHERPGVRAALRFSTRQMMSYLTAPFLPLGGIGCLLAFNATLGAAAALIPSVGEVVLGWLWGLVLFCGFLIAMLAVSVSIGWPLMVAAVSTEDSDGFDGLSRANGFLLDRAWLALFLATLSLPVYALSWLLVVALIHLVVYLAAWAVAAGDAGHTATWQWLWNLPAEGASSPREYWLELPGILLRGFGPSFFWCGVTVIYFLLRKSDDGTPLNDVMIRSGSAAAAENGTPSGTPQESSSGGNGD
ncbi:hypothetical protein GC176_07900 [bacterium]|nr:hypothetical protein [bacterium]